MPSGFQFPWVATEHLDAESTLYRLGPMFTARAGDDLGKLVASCETFTQISLAGDRWDISQTFTVGRGVTFTGRGTSTQLRKNFEVDEPMMEITADGVIIENIWFRDEAEIKNGTAIKVDDADDVVIRNCIFEGFKSGIQIVGGSRIHVHDCHMVNVGRNESGAVNIGVGAGTSANALLINNNIIQVQEVGDTANNRAILLESTVTDSVVCGNVCTPTTKIEFTNSGAAQTFAADGGSDNHVAGNSAVLVENT